MESVDVAYAKALEGVLDNKRLSLARACERLNKNGFDIRVNKLHAATRSNISRLNLAEFLIALESLDPEALDADYWGQRFLDQDIEIQRKKVQRRSSVCNLYQDIETGVERPEIPKMLGLAGAFSGSIWCPVGGANLSGSASLINIDINFGKRIILPQFPWRRDSTGKPIGIDWPSADEIKILRYRVDASLIRYIRNVLAPNSEEGLALPPPTLRLDESERAWLDARAAGEYTQRPLLFDLSGTYCRVAEFKRGGTIMSWDGMETLKEYVDGITTNPNNLIDEVGIVRLNVANRTTEIEARTGVDGYEKSRKPKKLPSDSEIVEAIEKYFDLLTDRDFSNQALPIHLSNGVNGFVMELPDMREDHGIKEAFFYLSTGGNHEMVKQNTHRYHGHASNLYKEAWGLMKS